MLRSWFAGQWLAGQVRMSRQSRIWEPESQSDKGGQLQSSKDIGHVAGKGGTELLSMTMHLSSIQSLLASGAEIGCASQLLCFGAELCLLRENTKDYQDVGPQGFIHPEGMSFHFLQRPKIG